MSHAKRPSGPSNTLVADLPRADRDRFLAECETVDLKLGETICEPGDPIRYVYFPTGGYISLVAPIAAAESLEVGMVGDEGMFGVTLMLDVSIAPLLGLVQGAGSALRLSARRFKRLRDESAALRKILNRYLYVLTVQLAQTAACNRFHLLDARLARWLLMTEDRAHSNSYPMTHKFLAYMLGVRRAGITEAAGRLQAMQLIRYSRGAVTVLDRAGLKKVSCPCYAALEQTYVEQLGRAAA